MRRKKHDLIQCYVRTTYSTVSRGEQNETKRRSQSSSVIEHLEIPVRLLCPPLYDAEQQKEKE